MMKKLSIHLKLQLVTSRVMDVLVRWMIQFEQTDQRL